MCVHFVNVHRADFCSLCIMYIIVLLHSLFFKRWVKYSHFHFMVALSKLGRLGYWPLNEKRSAAPVLLFRHHGF